MDGQLWLFLVKGNALLTWLTKTRETRGTKNFSAWAASDASRKGDTLDRTVRIGLEWN